MTICHAKAPQLSVILSHAGVQHSYPMALALQSGGYLAEFWTTYYQFHRKQPWLFPQTTLARRRFEGLREDRIHSYPWPEFFERVFSVLVKKNYPLRNHLVYLRNCWFDHHLAVKLVANEYDCLIGFSGTCLESLKITKQRNRLAVIDQPDIHPGMAEQLLKEEIERHPDFSGLIDYWPPHQGYLKRVRQELALADKIFVPSSFSFRTHVESGIPPQKLVLMPYGVSLPEPSMSRRTLVHRPFRILFVGTITQRKGIKYLLEAVKQISQKDLELVLIGNLGGPAKPLGPYRGFFKQVGFCSKNEIRQYYQSSHLLVLPSVYDSFGLVILEAMAHGLPVIVSENSAGRDVVREGKDGYVVPIRDVDALKDRILRLYQNKDLWMDMSRNAGERAGEFTWGHYQENMSRFLETETVKNLRQ